MTTTTINSSGKRCDFCSHMVETSTIESIHFSKTFRIHGHLSHNYAPEGMIRWFIYAINDLPCRKIIVGSTQDPVKRWSVHKSTCNKASLSKSTGLSKHFTQGEGCPFDTGKQKEITLIDFYDTTQTQKEMRRGHSVVVLSVGFSRILRIKNMLELGSIYGSSGLNERDEIVLKTRANWKSN